MAQLVCSACTRLESARDERDADPGGAHAGGALAGRAAERSGKDRAQIARWERDVVQPSFETLRELLRACGFDLETTLVPYEADSARRAAAEDAAALAAGAAAGDAEGTRR